MKLVTVASTKEPSVSVEFNVHKFTDRPRPDNKRRITIVSCLSEFGCETIGCLWCLPRISRENPSTYKIAVGWYGREYFYRHLVDEFWEIKEDYQWLRDYCKAFHNESKNLARLEDRLSDFGKVIKSHEVGQMVVGNKCRRCGYFWGDTNYVEQCPYCKGNDILRSLFGDIPFWRSKATLIPKPSPEKMALADKYLKDNSVGIFARGRKTYGRNLTPDFYVNLISALESMGYNPVWLGEKQSTLPCPVPHIFDYSRAPECRDLELTCAIVSKLKFTIQFWTASTRLSAFMGTPYILFESPMQITGEGQEGLRLGLLRDLAPLKLIVSHFLQVTQDCDAAIALVKQAVKEMNVGNYKPIVGLVENKAVQEAIMEASKNRLGIC